MLFDLCGYLTTGVFLYCLIFSSLGHMHIPRASERDSYCLFFIGLGGLEGNERRCLDRTHQGKFGIWDIMDRWILV